MHEFCYLCLVYVFAGKQANFYRLWQHNFTTGLQSGHVNVGVKPNMITKKTVFKT